MGLILGPSWKLFLDEAFVGGFAAAGYEVFVVAVRHDGIEAGPEELGRRELGEGGYGCEGFVLFFREGQESEVVKLGAEGRGGEGAPGLGLRVASGRDGFGEEAVCVCLVLPEMEELDGVLLFCGQLTKLEFELGRAL